MSQITATAKAETVSDLDISEGGPSVVDTHTISSQPPSHGREKVTFLTLPVEIRLLVYEQLLINRWGPSLKEWTERRGTDRREVIQEKLGKHRRRPTGVYIPIEPSIVRTCKQIHCEGNEILYSQNIFRIIFPNKMLKMIRRIRPANLQLIKNLEIWVWWDDDPLPWLKLLSLLAEKASGLRCIDLSWRAVHPIGMRRYERGHHLRGLGENLDFVKALGKIQTLEQLIIRGFYAKNWPAYLSKTMGVRVEAIKGHCLEEPKLKEEEDDGELRKIRWDNKDEVRDFERWQEGTESLIP